MWSDIERCFANLACWQSLLAVRWEVRKGLPCPRFSTGPILWKFNHTLVSGHFQRLSWEALSDRFPFPACQNSGACPAAEEKCCQTRYVDLLSGGHLSVFGVMRPYAHQRRTFSRLQPPRCRRTWLPGTPHLPSSLAAASFPNKFKSDFCPFTVPLFICIFWVHASMLINQANKIIQFNPPKLGAQLTSPRPNVFQRSTLQVGTICWIFQKSRYFKAPISKFSGNFGSLVSPRDPILSLLKMSLVSLQWPANWLHFPHIIFLKTRDYEIEEERFELDMRIPLSHMRHICIYAEAFK